VVTWILSKQTAIFLLSLYFQQYWIGKYDSVTSSIKLLVTQHPHRETMHPHTARPPLYIHLAELLQIKCVEVLI
jgi:hypothetical protein